MAKKGKKSRGGGRGRPRRDDPAAVDREIAVDASDAALDLIDDAIDDDAVTSIGNVLMQCALRVAQHAAAEMLLDKGLEEAERKRELSDDDFERLLDRLEDRVNHMSQDKLWKVFMELMALVLSRKTKGRYRVQIIEDIGGKANPNDEKDEEDEDENDKEEPPDPEREPEDGRDPRDLGPEGRD